MFESRVNPPPRRDLPQELLAAVVALFAVVIIFGVLAKQDAGHEASPWAWPIVGFLLAASAAIYEWHLLWRIWRPPLKLDPGALPSTFDWDAVGGEVAQITIGLPFAAVGIFQAMMLFLLLGSDILVRYRFRSVRHGSVAA